MYKRSHSPYLVQWGHDVLGNKCGHLQAILYVGKMYADAHMDVTNVSGMAKDCLF